MAGTSGESTDLCRELMPEAGDAVRLASASSSEQQEVCSQPQALSSVLPRAGTRSV